jgi:hypothetical protein
VLATVERTPFSTSTKQSSTPTSCLEGCAIARYTPTTRRIVPIVTTGSVQWCKSVLASATRGVCDAATGVVGWDEVHQHCKSNPPPPPAVRTKIPHISDTQYDHGHTCETLYLMLWTGTTCSASDIHSEVSRRHSRRYDGPSPRHRTFAHSSYLCQRSSMSLCPLAPEQLPNIFSPPFDGNALTRRLRKLVQIDRRHMTIRDVDAIDGALKRQ